MKLQVTYAGLMSFEQGEEPAGLPSLEDLLELERRAIETAAQDNLKQPVDTHAADSHNGIAS